jgi:hypothetical protein
VLAGVDDRVLRVPYGNWIAYQPALLVGLCALFVLMAGVRPWRRLRNLDVLATLSFVPAVVLFQHRYVDASLVATLPGMAYLLARCVRVGFSAPGASSPSTPLLHAITPGLDPARRVRWLRALLIVLALLFVMVGVGSPDAVDVLYAVMEGATRLIHGVLPYGHMPPGIVHGDTYPILSYALYTPLAALSPVSSIWNSVDAGLALAALAALLAAWAVFRAVAGPRPRIPRAGRAAELEEPALRAALAWLAFPPLLITVSTGTTDVALAAMLALALLVWRRPTLCAGILTVAGWFKFAPFALAPVALAPLRGRRLAGALAAIAVVSAASLSLVLALGGMPGVVDMARAVSYQFTRGSMQSIWSALGIAALQPLGQAGVLALLAAVVVKLRLTPSLGLDRVRMAAMAAAILIGLQLAADYWAFLYLVWVMPLVACSLLGSAHNGLTVPAEHRVAVGGKLEPASLPASGL